MKSATVSGVTSTYTYDGDGNRATKTMGSTTTNYVYDVNASLPNVLTDWTLPHVHVLALAYAFDSASNLQVYRADGLGSVRAMSDGPRNLVAPYQIDGFGKPTTVMPVTQPFSVTDSRHDAVNIRLDRSTLHC